MNAKVNGLKGILVYLSFLLAFSIGCARAPLNLPAQEMKALDYEATGVEAYKAHDYDRAFSKFKEAFRLNASIDNRRGMVFDLINLGRVSVELGEADVAIDYLSRAEALASAAKDDKLASEAIAAQAKALLWKGERDAATLRLNKAIEIDSRAGVSSGAKMNLLAAIRAEAGSYDEASKLYAAALKISEGNSDELEAANSLRALSALAERSGDNAQATRLRAGAYDLDRKSGDAVKIMDDLHALARLHEAAGSKSEAIFYFTRLYDSAGANDNKVLVKESLAGLVRILTQAGDADAAASYKRRLDALQEAVK